MSVALSLFLTFLLCVCLGLSLWFIHRKLYASQAELEAQAKAADSDLFRNQMILESRIAAVGSKGRLPELSELQHVESEVGELSPASSPDATVRVGDFLLTASDGQLEACDVGGCHVLVAKS